METRKRVVCVLVLTRVDYCNSALAGLSDSTLAPMQRCGGAVCPRPVATRSRHGCTAGIPLAAGAPAHHVQAVRINARCSFWLRADISTGRRRATLDTAVGCVAQLAERRSLAGKLTLSCARPSEDG